MTATLTSPQVQVEDCGPFKRYTFPSGDVVAFKEETHAYYTDCKQQTKKGEVVWTGTNPRFTGVSTVVKPFDYSPDQLMRWAANQDHEAIVELFGGQELPTDPAIVRARLRGNEMAWDQRRDAKADTGKAAHEKVLHQLAIGQEPDIGVLAPKERGFGQAIYRWWVARNPEVLHAEQVVCSAANRVAGTLDLRVRMDSTIGLDHREGIVLVDAKARGFIPASSLGQVAGYDKCVVDCGLGDPADHLLILKLREDGDFEEIWVDDGLPPEERHANFMAGVRVYRQAAEYTKQVQAVGA